MAFKRRRSGSYGKRKRSRSAPTRSRGRRRYLPSRIRGRKTYDRTSRIVNKTLRAISESKFRAYTPITCLAPVAKPDGTQPISYHFFNTGSNLAPLLPEFDIPHGPMDLFEFAEGTDANERIGKSMYLKHARVKFEVQMIPKATPFANQSPTTRFRLMIVKSKRALDKWGSQGADPGNSLFMNNDNTAFGYDDVTASTFAFMNQPINKREWMIYKQKYFTLSAPYAMETPGGSTQPSPVLNSKYPTRKQFNIKFPIMKKCLYNNTTNTPENVDTQWFVILQAVDTDYCLEANRPRNYFVNMLGTTCALDN